MTATATATYSEEFTGIEGVRELKDGRVVVLDAQDKAIHLIDLAANTGVRIGRDGDGPGEFRLPLEIWPVGDSAVVRDMARFGKLMVITPKGAIGGFVPMLDSALSTRSFNPTGVDAAGRFYGLEYTANSVYDSARVVRWDRARRTRDTVALFMSSLIPPKMNEGDVVRAASGRVAGVRRAARPRAFFAYNQWALAPDGRVAIVGASPYRVTYVNTNGSRTAGPVVNYRPVPVTEAEKEAWLVEASRPGPSLMMQRDGPMVATYRKRQAPTDVEWADVLPPFQLKAAHFASDGMLWVQRSTKAGAPALFDVFDASAKVAFQIELAAGRKLLGFGTGTVYLARVDEDDLHYLERYRLPGR